MRSESSKNCPENKLPDIAFLDLRRRYISPSTLASLHRSGRGLCGISCYTSNFPAGRLFNSTLSLPLVKPGPGVDSDESDAAGILLDTSAAETELRNLRMADGLDDCPRKFCDDEPPIHYFSTTRTSRDVKAIPHLRR